MELGFCANIPGLSEKCDFTFFDRVLCRRAPLSRVI